MTGNVLLNGKKRRLDYGVLVSHLYTYINIMYNIIGTLGPLFSSNYALSFPSENFRLM